MKVTHFNLLNTGGAYTAACRIVEGQKQNGIEATLETYHDMNLFERFGSRIKSKLDYELNSSIIPPITISYFSSLSRIHADNLLNLHWVPGPLPRILGRLNDVPAVVWTLHDTNPFTAICHNPMSCSGFANVCNSCPQKGFLPNALVRNKLRTKRNSATRRGNLQVVAPSRWIAALASESYVFESVPISVIPNAVPLDVFSPTDRNLCRKELGVDDFFVVGFLSPKFGSAKGGKRAKDIFKKFATKHSHKVKGIEIGAENDEESPEVIKVFPRSDEEMSKVLKSCDALIYTSLADNLPNLLLEAQACGTPLVSVDIGGTTECFVENSSGFVFRENLEAVKKLEDLLLHPDFQLGVSKKARTFAIENFDPQDIAKKYEQVYSQALRS